MIFFINSWKSSYVLLLHHSLQRDCSSVLYKSAAYGALTSPAEPSAVSAPAHRVDVWRCIVLADGHSLAGMCESTVRFIGYFAPDTEGRKAPLACKKKVYGHLFAALFAQRGHGSAHVCSAVRSHADPGSLAPRARRLGSGRLGLGAIHF